MSKTSKNKQSVSALFQSSCAEIPFKRVLTADENTSLCQNLDIEELEIAIMEQDQPKVRVQKVLILNSINFPRT